jgi:branched-chain amino acid transport system ATP-binding protein
MAEALLAVERLVKRFGGLVATDHLSLDVRLGETHALIGPNGAGKTTLIAQLQGEILPDEGQIHFGGQDITHAAPHRRAQQGLARSFQITSVFPDFSLLANVVIAVQGRARQNFSFWRRALSERALVDAAREALDIVGLGFRTHHLARDVSHGERRQLELAMALAMKPRLLLLDEPMAGMGRQDGARMTRILDELKSRYAMLLVEHDMDAVFTLADRVSVLVSGRVIATGSADAVRADPEVRAAYLGQRH